MPAKHGPWRLSPCSLCIVFALYECMHVCMYVCVGCACACVGKHQVGLCDGQIRVRLTGTPDYEVAQSYLLTIAARPNGLTVSQAVANVTVTVVDVPEPPFFFDDYTRSVYENQTAGIGNTFGAPVQGEYSGSSLCGCQPTRRHASNAHFSPFSPPLPPTTHRA
jgi:hypothetical protein